jgi:hypothetical protein
MIDEKPKPPHGLGMWQRRFVSRDELLERYSMSDEKPSPAELSDFLRSFSSDQYPDDGRMMCAAADVIDDAAAMLELLQRVQWAIEDSDGTPPFGTALLGDISALLDKHGRAR